MDPYGRVLTPSEKEHVMDVRIELILVPVSDVDRARAFYGDTLGWPVDHDQTVSEDLRFVQVTPPGSACSIAFGRGISEMAPGSLQALQAVIDSADDALADLTGRGSRPAGSTTCPGAASCASATRTATAGRSRSPSAGREPWPDDGRASCPPHPDGVPPPRWHPIGTGVGCRGCDTPMVDHHKDLCGRKRTERTKCPELVYDGLFATSRARPAGAAVRAPRR